MSIVLMTALQVATPSASAEPAALKVIPDWRRRATGEDVRRVYPSKANYSSIPGRAVMSCGVGATGYLVDCRVLQEFPKDYGFGAAALKLAPAFEMRPLMKDGRSVDGGVVRIPIQFSMGQTDRLSLTLSCYGLVSGALATEPNRADLQRAKAAFEDAIDKLFVDAAVADETEKPLTLETARIAGPASLATREGKGRLIQCLGAVKPAKG